MNAQILFTHRPNQATMGRIFLRIVLLAVIGVGLTWTEFIASPAFGLQFETGELTGTLDTTVTVGASIRVEERDRGLVGVANGGTANSINSDDGNLNYDQGDITSLSAKVTHEVDLNWRNFGFFGRMYYFYDWAVMQIPTERTTLNDAAQRQAGRNIRILDAYLLGNFDVLDRPITVRVGNQVLSWGESTWIQNGINVINPVDVSALRVAGAELRDALMPVPMLSFIADITDTISIEGFYQFYWSKTETEPGGTYFSTNDFAGPGGEYVYLGFGRAPDDPERPGPMDNPPTGVGNLAPIGGRVWRTDDAKPSDMFQGGVALRYFAPWLFDTEFGLFYVHYHSRLPLLSGFTGDAPPPPPADPFDIGNWIPNHGRLLVYGLLDGDYASSAAFRREYPENLSVLGGSTNFTVFGIAVQGEFSYHMDQPLQMDDAELLFGALSSIDPHLRALSIVEQSLGGGPIVDPGVIFGRSQIAQAFGPFGFNEYVRGWVRKDYIQPQMTLTKVFGPMLGMDQFVCLAEIGATYVLDMYTERDANGRPIRFEGPGTFTSGNPWFSPASQGGVSGIQPVTQTTGFANDLSWGYRVAARATFNNAIGPITIMPAAAFSHDVQGTSPSPILNFIEDRMSATVSVTFDYLNKLKYKMSYSAFFGAGVHNLLHDRDLASVSASYSF